MLKTAKYQALVEDPVIRYKSVEALPGISPVYGRRLRDAGFDTADKVLQKYLTLNRNENRFTLWLSLSCGANSRLAAQCFSALNEWYYTWGKDAHIPKIKKASSVSSVHNSLTNRMLLEQKILQFNFNSSDERLKSLADYQTRSLLNVSRPQRSSPENLSKSHANISIGLPCAVKGKKKENNRYHSLASLMSPVQKCVNFKENEIIENQTSRKFKVPTSPTRTISPILKTRTIAPQAKISKNITIKKVSAKPSITKFNLPSENKFKSQTSNPKSNTKCSTLNRHVSSPNIEEYFDEVKKVDKRSKIILQTRNKRKDSFSADSLTSCEFHNEDSAFDMTTESQAATTEDERESIGTPLASSLTESNEGFPRSEKPVLKLQDSFHESDLSDCSDIHKNKDEGTNISKKETENCTAFSESYMNNSNEDSGLDVNTNGLVEFPNESSASDDDCSTPFENIDSLSENSTDRTYEINETTDAESAFNYITSTKNSSDTEAFITNANDHNEMENVVGSTDNAKRENVRLFCDMLSNDLEQLPFDKFRNLKLKILQLVYAEIDECGLK